MLDSECKATPTHMAQLCETKAAELREDPAFLSSLPKVFVTQADIPYTPVLAVSTYGLTARMHSEVAILLDPIFLESEYPILLGAEGMLHVVELTTGFIEDAMGLNAEETLEQGGNYVIRGHRCRICVEVKAIDGVLAILGVKAKAPVDQEKFLSMVFGMTRALYRNTDFPFVMLVMTHVHFGDFTCEKMVDQIETNAAEHPWTH